MTDIPTGLTSRQEIVEIDIFDRLSGSIRDALLFGAFAEARAELLTSARRTRDQGWIKTAPS
jgi:hypothetical protein